uniref:Uncharacterized protein n=1 Tax=Arundo donax TaxID=35708 RepID=A0A0A9BHK5_ARUDO
MHVSRGTLRRMGPKMYVSALAVYFAKGVHVTFDLRLILKLVLRLT